jgi:hypothetical protein
LASCGIATQAPLQATGIPSSSINIALQIAACSNNDCFVAGATMTPLPQAATVERLTRGGALAPVTAPTMDAGSLTGASCTSSACYLGGEQDGHDVLWSYNPAAKILTIVNQASVHLPGASAGISALSCLTTSCAYVDLTSAHLARLVLFGASGTTVTPVPTTATESVTALGCDSNLCEVGVATPRTTRLLVYASSSGWTVAATPSSWQRIDRLSCQTSCVALVSTGGHQQLAWSTAKGWQTVAAPFAASDVACLPGQQCVVVGANAAGGGAAWWWHHGDTRTVHLTYVPTPLTAVACGLTRCVATAATTAVELAP